MPSPNINISSLVDLFDMLPNGTAIIVSLLAWTVASLHVSRGTHNIAPVLMDQGSNLRTEFSSSEDKRPVNHEYTLAPNREGDGVGPEQKFSVSYLGSTETGVMNSAMRVNTPASNATGRKS